MQDLSAGSGLPKTTIHHYIREGLLPPARKSATNAALYGAEHAERLRLIVWLRGDRNGGLSIPQIRQVLAYVGAGVEPSSAVRLVAGGVEVAADIVGQGDGDSAALQAATGLGAEVVDSLTRAGLIGEPAEGYSADDLLVARACSELCGGLGVDPDDLTPLDALVREIGSYCVSVVDLYAAQAASRGEDPSEVSRRLRSAFRGFLDAILWRAVET